MKKLSITMFICLFLLIGSNAFGAELNGWIKVDIYPCWVVKSPSMNSPIIGIINKKAAVTVEKAEKGWLKIIFAPIRDPKTGKWIECTGCYIQESNFTTELPNRW